MNEEYYDIEATEGIVWTPLRPKGNDSPPVYKFRENELIDEFHKYVDATYNQHYSREKFQALEFIYDGGHGEGFNVGNILKYGQRYGKKGTRADARKDMVKVLHYALLQLYIHDEETKRLASDKVL